MANSAAAPPQPQPRAAYRPSAAQHHAVSATRRKPHHPAAASASSKANGPCPRAAASSAGEKWRRDRIPGFAPAARSATTRSARPDDAATCSGVHPSRSTAFASAPADRRTWQQLSEYSAARCSGALPLAVRASTAAPFRSSSSAIAGHPRDAASCNADQPSFSLDVGEPPTARQATTAAKDPLRTAYTSALPMANTAATCARAAAGRLPPRPSTATPRRQRDAT